MRKQSIFALFLAFGLLALAASGEQVYVQCAGCHQASGAGVAGAFPPLAGELPRLAAAGEAGRLFPVKVLLFGLRGPIEAQGKPYNASMPSFGWLSDADIAAVLNYVFTNWGNDKLLPKGFKPISAEEVKALRAKALTAQQVHEQWQKLGLK